MKRRQFVQLACAATLATTPHLPGTITIGREPFKRSGPARFRLGLAAYSMREYFRFMKGKVKTPREDGAPIDMVGFLDYCVANEVEAAELTSYFFPPNANADYFRKLKHEAFVRGVTISGTAIGNNFTVGQGDRLQQEIAATIKWIDHAAELGAPHIRIFAGTGREIQQEPKRIDEAIEAVAQCAEHAAKRGVFLGVENHGNLTSDQMLEIMSRVSSAWVGMNLDTGNFFSDNPYRDLERCVDYAVNVQVKLMMTSPEKKKYPADMDRIASILRKSGYQGFVILEYEEDSAYEEIPDAIKQLRTALETA